MRTVGSQAEGILVVHLLLVQKREGAAVTKTSKAQFFNYTIEVSPNSGYYSKLQKSSNNQNLIFNFYKELRFSGRIFLFSSTCCVDFSFDLALKHMIFASDGFANFPNLG